MTEAQYCILKNSIKEIVDVTMDSIRFYFLNKNEKRRTEVLGVETAYKVDDPLII